MLEHSAASKAQHLVERLRQFPLDTRPGAIGTWVEIWVQLGGPVPLALAGWIEDLRKGGLVDEAQALASLAEAHIAAAIGVPPRRIRGTVAPEG